MSSHQAFKKQLIEQSQHSPSLSEQLTFIGFKTHTETTTDAPDYLLVMDAVHVRHHPSV